MGWISRFPRMGRGRPRRRGEAGRTRRRSAPARLEMLEGRVTMTASMVGETLRIEGTDGADRVVVRYDPGPLPSAFDDGLVVTETSGGTPRTSRFKLYTVETEEGFPGARIAEYIRRIEFEGRRGDDTFTNEAGVRSRARGGDGRDALTGGSAGDDLEGGPGADTLDGRGGDDFLDGGRDRVCDVLIGGEGGDTFVNYLYLDAPPTARRDGARDYDPATGDTVSYRIVPPPGVLETSVPRPRVPFGI